MNPCKRKNLEDLENNLQTPVYYPDIFKAENNGGGALWRLDLHDMVSSTVFEN